MSGTRRGGLLSLGAFIEKYKSLGLSNNELVKGFLAQREAPTPCVGYGTSGVDIGEEPSRTVITVLGPDGKNANGDLIVQKSVDWGKVTDPTYRSKPVQFANAYLGQPYAPPPDSHLTSKQQREEEFLKMCEEPPSRSMAETLKQLGSAPMQPPKILMSRETVRELIRWAHLDGAFAGLDQDLQDLKEATLRSEIKRRFESEKETYVFPDVSNI